MATATVQQLVEYFLLGFPAVSTTANRLLKRMGSVLVEKCTETILGSKVQTVPRVLQETWFVIGQGTVMCQGTTRSESWQIGNYEMSMLPCNTGYHTHYFVSISVDSRVQNTRKKLKKPRCRRSQIYAHLLH